MFKIEKGYESVNKTFRIPVPMAEELERLAGKNNVSLNNVVVQCLSYALEHLDESEANAKTEE